MHRASAPVRAAVDAPEQLGHHVLRGRPAHERVAVRAVCRDQVVAVAQRAGAADDRRLLADRQVQEAADLGSRVHLARALLEAPDERHRREPLARDVRLGKVGHQLPRYSSARGTHPPRAAESSARSARASREAACGGRSQNSTTSPLVDLHDLDVVDAPRVGQERRRAPAARDDQPVGVVGLHARRPGAGPDVAGAGAPPMYADACSSERSPTNTRSPTRTAGTSVDAAGRRRIAGRVELLRDRAQRGRLAAPPRGCISHAAAAISTKSARARASGRRRTPGGRRPARTVRRGRSTWRTSPRASPASLSNGNGSGQRSGCRPSSRARRASSARKTSCSAARRSASSRLGAGQLAREHRLPLGRAGQHVQDALGCEVGKRACEVEVEGGVLARTLPAQRQPWISQPSAARPASITASDSVGWPWTMRATSA